MHLLLGDTVLPLHMSVFQPDSAFYGQLAPGDEIEEAFRLALPLYEVSPYQPVDFDAATVKVITQHKIDHRDPVLARSKMWGLKSPWR